MYVSTILRQLREEDVGGRLAPRLRDIVAGERGGQLENQFLLAARAAEVPQRHFVDSARTREGQPTIVVLVEPFDFDLWRDSPRIKENRGHVRPIHGHVVPHALRVAFHAGKTDFQARFRGNRVDVAALGAILRRAFRRRP